MTKFLSPFVILLAMASIQFGASQAKGLIPMTGAAGATTLRLLVAGLTLLLIFRPKDLRPSKNLFIYGLSLGLMNLTFYFAIARIPLGIAVALEFVGPLTVALFSSRSKRDIFWALLAATGLTLLLPFNMHEVSALDPIGVLFALIAGACWASYIIFGKKAGESAKGPEAVAVGMLTAALVVLPFGAIFDGAKIFQVAALPLALVVGIFGSALPYTLEMSVLKKMSPATFGILMSLEPVMATIMGIIFLGENLELSQYFAILCIMISSLGSTLTQK